MGTALCNCARVTGYAEVKLDRTIVSGLPTIQGLSHGGPNRNI
jgi:hypothetical protein